jgi:hypothetical protein
MVNILMSTKTTLVVLAIMAALALTTVSTFVDSALAKPSGVPPSPPGGSAGECASTVQGQGAETCAPEPPFGRGPPSR